MPTAIHCLGYAALSYCGSIPDPDVSPAARLPVAVIIPSNCAQRPRCAPTTEYARMNTHTTIRPHGRIVIAGGTGFLGRNLARTLAAYDCDVVLISRRPPAVSGPWRHAAWAARTLGDWAAELDGAAALVNLTGRSVDCIKSPDHCDEILRSRVESTRALGRAVRAVDTPPPVWVQMSTAHIVGDPPEVVCDESSADGFGLAPSVGRAWEDAFAEAVLPTMRPVILRTSFVLGKTGGALPKLSAVTRLGLGGRAGHGRQGISWIHENDMNRLFLRAITDEQTQGVYLATAPNPVSNAQFMRALRRALGIPFGLPAAAWMVRVGAPLVLRTDPELALYGRYCVPTRLQEEGFEFEFTDVDEALEDLYRRRRPRAAPSKPTVDNPNSSDDGSGMTRRTSSSKLNSIFHPSPSIFEKSATADACASAFTV